ncbi:hypothetical protein [Parasphingorhabdus sp.]
MMRGSIAAAVTLAIFITLVSLAEDDPPGRSVSEADSAGIRAAASDI